VNCHKIIDQFSETNVEAIVNGTDVDNSNEYEPNQNVSNSNSEEHLLYYNDKSVNSKTNFVQFASFSLKHII
jgi:hypothetical protein